MNTLPSIFISHGSPMIALEPGAAGAFLQRLGPAIDASFGRPKAIVVASAHTTAREPALLAGAQHHAVYDFGNFDAKLFTLRYDAPGEPAVARRTAELLRAARLPVHVIDQGGLDHGIWTALRYVYPQADIPVVPLAFVPHAPPVSQFTLGQALAPLCDEGVLVLGTGSITHNLRRVFSQGLGTIADQPEAPDSAAFRAWMHRHSSARDWDALFDYRRQAPHAVEMHPTDEHLLPFYIAAGAGGRDAVPARLHASVSNGVLGMDTYAFGPGAQRLQAALA
ncbi:MAG TPA: class III extradiol ring-cleavage dioxygenase [Albitalea sp.]|nr:class III extradiol ring-cleavage dioxygenase [Albitalea sp.]